MIDNLVFGLTYHGSTAQPLGGLDNVFGKHISAALLRSHLEWLQKRFQVLTIPEILQRRQQGRLPKRTAFVAFHDGYLGNYEVAFGLLKQLNLPADFFIPTAFIGTNRRFWVDLLDAALKHTSRPDATLNGAERRQPISLQTSGEKQQAALVLRRHLKSLPQADFDLQFRLLLDQLGWSDSAQIPKLGEHERCLDWRQVKEMAEAGMSFGSHTHRHLICCRQDDRTVKEELAVSKQRIEEELGAPCPIFCYPNGSYPDSGNDATDQMAAAVGYWAVLYMVSPYNVIREDTFRLTGIALGQETEFSKFKMALSPLRYRWYRWTKRPLWPWPAA